MRKISFVLLFASVVAIPAVFLIYGSQFFASFGISRDSGLTLSLFSAFPTSLFLGLLWVRFVLKVPLPSSRQVFLHPKKAMKTWAMKMIMALYVVSAVLFFIRFYDNIPALGISIGVTVASIYSLMVEFEVAYLMAGDQRVRHPFRQKYN